MKSIIHRYIGKKFTMNGRGYRVCPKPFHMIAKEKMVYIEKYDGKIDDGVRQSISVAMLTGVLNTHEATTLNQTIQTAHQHQLRSALIAMEFGFKCCEKGMNLEAAREALIKLYD